MKKLILPLAALAWLLGGCLTVSLQPLYTEDDLVFEPSLVGRFGDPDDDRDEQWMFEEAGENAYTVTILAEGKPEATFEGRLLRLRDHLFLDLFPKPVEGASDLLESHLVPAHSFWRVEVNEETLRLGIMKREWLEQELREGRLNLPHENRQDALVLTASTAELQNLVLSHLEECFEWSEPQLRLP